MEEPRLSHLTREFMRRYEARVGQGPPKILCKPFTHSSARTSGQREFVQYNDIDAFCAAMRKETSMTGRRDDREDYHGSR